MQPTRRSFLLSAATLLATPWTGCKRLSGPSTAKKLNIVLVTLDTTRADYLGCYEPRHIQNTPNIDRVAAEGVQFMHCFSASAATPVSHASILTGLYPYEHGLRVIYAKSGCRLAADVPYLPELLQQAGWKTAAFLSSFTVSEFYGFQRGFNTFDSGLTRDPQALFRQNSAGRYEWGVADNQRRADRTTDEAVAWLDQVEPGAPFFLWVHYWDPHDRTPGVPQTEPPPEFSRPFLRNAAGSPDSQGRAMYEAEVAYVDLQFGRLVHKLKGAGLYDNTLLVVVADHGQGLGDHDWWAHRLLYQEQIRVPLLVRGPGWPAGKRIDAVARTIDIAPTIAGEVGVAIPKETTGASLKALLHDAGAASRLAYADGPHKFDLNAAMLDMRPRDGNLYCLTDGRWKLLLRLDDPEDSELFDLVRDPREARNVYRTETSAAERLRRILDDMQPFCTEPFPDHGGTDRGALKALESLGYVGGATDDLPETQPASQGSPQSE